MQADEGLKSQNTRSNIRGADGPCRGAKKIRGADDPESRATSFYEAIEDFFSMMKNI